MEAGDEGDDFDRLSAAMATVRLRCPRVYRLAGLRLDSHVCMHERPQALGANVWHAMPRLKGSGMRCAVSAHKMGASSRPCGPRSSEGWAWLVVTARTACNWHFPLIS